MSVLLPLTLHQAQAMAQMQRLQPELKKLRERHKKDRQRLNEETLALYQRHGVNPARGCLPSLVQLPVMIVMYRVIRGLTFHDAVTGDLAPRYVDHASALYRSLQQSGGRMVSFGMDLTTSALASHRSMVEALPFFVLAALVVATSVWQQRMALARSGATASPSRATSGLSRVMPALTGLMAVSLPAGVGVYYLTSNLIRVGQQHLLRRRPAPAPPEPEVHKTGTKRRPGSPVAHRHVARRRAPKRRSRGGRRR